MRAEPLPSPPPGGSAKAHTGSSLTLDHVGAIGRDLPIATSRWGRLGFTLSAQSRQRGAVPGKAGMQSWGSANRCAVFQRGYVELIGVIDPMAYHPWTHFLDRFEGLHLLALRCDNADAAFARLAARAPFLDPPLVRERKLMYRGEEHTMRFRNIFSRDAECPEGRYIVIEHQTPQLLWQPELMAHENGAIALVEAVIVADDPRVAMRISALDSIPQLQTPRQFAVRFGWTPPSPCIAAITITFADLERTVHLLHRRGIIVQRAGDERWLKPEDTNGFVLRLTQHV